MGAVRCRPERDANAGALVHGDFDRHQR